MENELRISNLIDELGTLRTKRDKLQAAADRKIKPVEAEMSEVAQKIQDHMKTLGLERAGSTKFSYTFKEVDEFQLEDPAKFYKWMQTTGNVHCLQRRLAQKAIEEVASKKRGKIPGLTTKKVPRATLSTLGSRK